MGEPQSSSSEPQRYTPEVEARYEAQVRAYRPAFERLARRLAGNADDAEDLLQESLVDAYRSYGRLRPNSHFYSWVARILTNNHLDRARRKRLPQVSLEQPGAGDAETLELPDEAANPERLLLHQALDGPYQSALEALQPLQRAVVVRCDLDGATYEEAARAESCPVGTVRSRLHRAHTALRDFLSALEPRSVPQPSPAAPARTASRRHFLLGTVAAAGAAVAHLNTLESADAADGPDASPIRVLVWTEGPGPGEEDLGSALADALRTDRRLEVSTAGPEDPHQGLPDAVLARTDVLVWWGARRHSELREDRAAAVARRVRDGGMGLIALHGARDSRPIRVLLGEECRWPAASAETEALDLRVTAPRHPIVEGIAGFRLPRAHRSEGVFRGPKPDVVVLDGAYPDSGGSAWQGMVWRIGEGRLFYFQPGPEAAAAFRQEPARQVLLNAARWCAGRSG